MLKVNTCIKQFIEGGKKEKSMDDLIAVMDNMIAVMDKSIVVNDNMVGTILEVISENKTEVKIEIKEYIVEIISYLNEKTLKNFLPTTNTTVTLIQSRWNEGYRRNDFFKVIDTKTADWLNDDYMNKFLRPSTLFGHKFENYLNEERRQSSRTLDDYLNGLE
ncbi:conserved phage C-terminal domain-containing protein [Evansella tamaricis]|uniref:Conserved phage C-terminal domain-containing protein n=1 Tax=Evansella tamaricis TaxID=2069301 RepID=A0ABS6JKA0_9BACI|nr:conserved phage C-terminal domain-containing protein [Evansella tamaricis]MBU9714100.1 conserved phage C-terminal domain-containing protein [Evansella tamaricis]